MEDGQLWCSSGSMCSLPSDKKGIQLKDNHKLCMGDLCVSKPEFEKLKRTPQSSGGNKSPTKTFAKGSGWDSAINVNAPVHPESLYSLHFGDGKDLHGRQAGVGYIKDQPNRVFGNTRGTLATHIHEADDLHWYTSGWKPMMAVKGGSGNAWIRGDLSVKEGKVKIQDNIEVPNGELRISAQGIMLGGPNKDREHNSAQISAGKHIANSLNLVGMSSGKGHHDRRVDMWAEGGFNVHGHAHVHNTANFRGGVSNMNPNKWWTHFPWHGDNKNYIRGDTEIRGHTNQMGTLRVSTNHGPADANSEQLVIGNTNESNLRLGRHKDYSWIQSHGSKPLLVNPLGNELRVKDIVVEGNIIMRHPNGQEWVIGMRDPNHFAINKLDRSGRNKGDGSGMLIRADGHVWSGGGAFHQGSHDQNWYNHWQHNIHMGRR